MLNYSARLGEQPISFIAIVVDKHENSRLLLFHVKQLGGSLAIGEPQGNHVSRGTVPLAPHNVHHMPTINQFTNLEAIPCSFT